MVSALCIALALPLSELPPLERLMAFLKRSPNLDAKMIVEFRASEEGPFEKYDGSLTVVKPNLQALRLTQGSLYMEWIQIDSFAMELDSEIKSYFEYYNLPRLLPPPPKTQPLLNTVYPTFLFGLEGTPLKSDKWKTEGNKAILDQMTGGGGFKMELEIDPDGKPISAFLSVRAQESYDVKYAFQSVSQGAIPRSRFSPDPPFGWMPRALGENTPVGIGSKGANVSFFNAVDSKPKTLKDVVGGGPTLLIFLDQDCPASKSLHPALPKILAALSKKGIKAAQISLGSKAFLATPGAASFHDSKGELERSLGIPSTPYLTLMDNTLQVWASYSSWAPDEEKKLIDTFLNYEKAAKE